MTLRTLLKSAPSFYPYREFQLTFDRLRVKVHVPYETLQTLLNRLHKFQEASDLLRRTSRFITLTKRLQTHMNEIQGIKGFTEGEELATATVLHGRDIEDERDRAIAKAALTISELSAWVSLLCCFSSTNTSPCRQPFGRSR
jgi:hypothetical protein